MINLIDKTLAPPFAYACLKSIKSLVDKMLKKLNGGGGNHYL